MEYRKNDLVTVEITDIGADGEGIGRADGFLLFVKDAVVGDVVEARITRPKKQYAYAKTEKVVSPSPFRVRPRCAFYRQCGGCQIQACAYSKQLAFKENKVKNNLIRIGGFDAELVQRVTEPVVGMEEPFRYRNKAQYPVGTDKAGNPIVGFYAGRTHSIIANTECFLGPEENRRILEAVLDYMRENKVSAYEEESGRGLIRHILIRTGFASGQIMVCLIINAASFRELPAQEKLLHRLTALEGITSVSVNLNTRRDNVIMGDVVHTIWGEPFIMDTLCIRGRETVRRLTFKISPLSFYQVNPVQTEKLYSLALEYAGLTGEETVWDLYCGIGTISLFMASEAKQVYGVEVVPQAVRDAEENAGRNGFENVTFFTGRAEEVLPEFYSRESFREPETDMRHPDVIVVDPPRKGCDEACISTMLRMAPQRIVYVSCDSATLARDLKLLCQGGYQLRRVRPVDMFPMTGHVETVCLLSKLNVEHHIEVELNLDEMDLTAAESKATYEEIKAYVKEQTGLQVSNLYIAQVKRKCGIIERVNYNLSKSEESRQPQCPPEKEKAIRSALKYFKMI